MSVLRSIGAVSMGILLAAQPALADCVEEAVRDVRSGTVLTIRRADGSVDRGTYVGFEPEPSRLLIAKRLYSSRRPPKTFELAAAEIAQIDYEPSHFDGKWVLLGTVGGGFVLAALAKILAKDPQQIYVDPYTSPVQFPSDWYGGYGGADVTRAAKAGMVLGLVIGTVAAGRGATHERRTCPEVPAEIPTGVQSPSDSLQTPIR